MRDLAGGWSAAAAGLGLPLILACATGSSPGQAAEPATADDCTFEVRNETRQALTVTAGGSRVQQLGTLDPGEGLRFDERCDVDEVLVTGTSTETGGPTVDPRANRSRDRMIQRRAGPWPGHVVVVSLRFAEQIRPGTRRIEGSAPPPAGGEGLDSLLTPVPTEPPPPGSAEGRQDLGGESQGGGMPPPPGSS